MANLDAAWTDALLASAALGGAAWAWSKERSRWITPAGLLILGSAATVGTFRLGGFEVLGPAHDGLSAWVGLVGLPTAAIGVIAAGLSPTWHPRLARLAVALLLVGTALLLLLDPATVRTVRTPISGAALLGAIAVSARTRNLAGAIGPALVLFAGLVVLDDSRWLGFHRLGWFHLVMAPAAILLARGSRPAQG